MSTAPGRAAPAAVWDLDVRPSEGASPGHPSPLLRSQPLRICGFGQAQDGLQRGRSACTAPAGHWVAAKIAPGEAEEAACPMVGGEQPGLWWWWGPPSGPPPQSLCWLLPCPSQGWVLGAVWVPSPERCRPQKGAGHPGGTVGEEMAPPRGLALQGVVGAGRVV